MVRVKIDPHFAGADEQCFLSHFNFAHVHQVAMGHNLIPSWSVHIAQLLGRFLGRIKLNSLSSEIVTDDQCDQFGLKKNFFHQKPV
jgi:hypothetical protein